ncbi:MAG: hypothetical protein R3C53_00755 [Pirellulaceae bacterium]
MFDVWIMLAFGGIGFALERMKLPLAPFVLGLVLAPIGEEHLSEGLMQTGGSYWPLVTRPVSFLFSVCALLILTWSLWQYRKHNQSHEQTA